MAKKRLTPSVKRSRTRSGCLTCRDRHVKCDEQQPVCKNCIKSKRKCYRGIRLNFTQYTIYNPDQATTSTSTSTPLLENHDHSETYHRHRHNQDSISDPTLPSSSTFKLLDQSITIASLYENGRQSYEPYLHLHQPEELRESDLQYQKDLYCSFPAFSSTSAAASLMSATSASNITPSISSGFTSNLSRHNLPIDNKLISNPSSSQQQQHHQTLQHLQHPQHPQFHQRSSANWPPLPFGQFSSNSNISPSSHLHNFENINNDTILENYDITNFLLNDSSMSNTISRPNNNNETSTTASYNVPKSPLREPPPHTLSPLILPQHQKSSTANESTDTAFNLNSIPENERNKNINDNPNRSRTQISDEITKFSIDINQFIHLIQNEKFYWILDLFNEMNIWKLIIPSYCLKMTEYNDNYDKLSKNAKCPNEVNFALSHDYASSSNLAKGYQESNQQQQYSHTSQQRPLSQHQHHHHQQQIDEIELKLLINCLLSCSDQNKTKDISQILDQQLKQWYDIRNLEITSTNYSRFERLLISIVLIFLNFLHKFQCNIPVTEIHLVILNNQIKIFNKLCTKFNSLSNSNLKKFKTVIFISSLHSVSILKYLVNKEIKRLSIKTTLLSEDSQIHKKSKNESLSTNDDDSIEDINEELSYDLEGPVNIRNKDSKQLYSLSKFELININSCYKNLDFIQLSYKVDDTDDESSFTPNLSKHHPSASVTSLSSSASNSCSPSTMGQHQHLQNLENSKPRSDASKLREYIWHLIKLDNEIETRADSINEFDYNFILQDTNIIQTGEKLQKNENENNSSNTEVSNKFESHPQPSQIRESNDKERQSSEESQISKQDDTSQVTRTLLPNERGIAINIIREYITKLINHENHDIKTRCNTRMKDIFDIVETSMIDADIKDQLSRNFKWVLHD